MSWVCRGVRMGMVTLSVAMAVTRVAGFANNIIQTIWNIFILRRRF